MRTEQRRRRFVFAWVLALGLGGCVWWGILERL
ncbi:hypothetical protein ENKNEFLB_03542 [Nocardioides aquaticus]|uniref:Uncharacterized protein n=1 Tax=Nocardioides aquaticus TaxID=160826 RepID=A0ABX8EKS8_9ACTN|nr:hypothetical protein ENKNEFLB_03542 [Nocardioides aquaticus]